MGHIKDAGERMHVLAALGLAFVSALGAAQALARSDGGTAPAVQPDSPAALRQLCRGQELCWVIVMTPPRDGAFIVQTKFPEPRRFIGLGDSYCDRREYWLVSGASHRLIAADCAEQWGPDSQGPVDVWIEGNKVKLSYVEWEYDADCETSSAVLDLATGKTVSVKRWAGRAAARGKACRALRSLKPHPNGDGLQTPVVAFRADPPPPKVDEARQTK